MLVPGSYDYTHTHPVYIIATSWIVFGLLYYQMTDWDRGRDKSLYNFMWDVITHPGSDTGTLYQGAVANYFNNAPGTTGASDGWYTD